MWREVDPQNFPAYLNDKDKNEANKLLALVAGVLSTQTGDLAKVKRDPLRNIPPFLVLLILAFWYRS